MSGSSYVIGIVLLAAAAIIVLMVVQMRRVIPHVAAQRLGRTGGVLAGLGVGSIVLGALGDRLDTSPRWVGIVAALVLLLLPTLLAAMGGQQATALARRHATPPPSGAPVMHLEPGQRVVWTRTVSSTWLLVPAVAVLTLGPLVVFAPDVPLWVLGVVVFAGVACLSLASIRVTADAGGLSVKYGVLPWPSTDIAVDRIAAASVIDVRPAEWGGWGYRGTLTLMRQAAVVLRSGPGIRLDLADGRVFVVTVDDPEMGVALLNAEVARLPA